MESSGLRSSNNKGIIICILLLAMSLPSFSQSKLAALASSVKVEFAVPAICVIGFGLFMLGVFIRQKDHK